MSVDIGPGFKFPTTLPMGAAYAVTVRTNPFGQRCIVSANGSGVINAADVNNVSIACTTPTSATNYTIGGTVSGLTKSGLVLANGADQVTLAAQTTQFTFPTAVPTYTVYMVSIVSQPASQTCSLINESGTVANAPVTTVTISCSPTSTQAGLSVDKASLSFVAEQGVPLPTQTIVGTVQGAIAPVIVNIAYTTNGVGYADYYQLSTNSGQLIVVPKTSTGTPGTYNDTITITACYDTPCTRPLPGSPKIIPVTTTIQPAAPPPVLMVSEHGVAFATVPGQARLTRSLTVTDSTSMATTWTATSNQAWLTVTSSGASGGTLELNANPTGLSDGFYKAHVTVASSNPALTSQTINIGLYVSSIPSATTFEIPPTLYSCKTWLPPSNFSVDPIRPLAYTASGSSIAIDHVYTGARLGTINVAGASYNSIATGDDGSYLYALNVATGKLDVIDIDAQQVISSLPLPPVTDPFGYHPDQFRIQYARVHGKPVLIFNSITIAGLVTTPIVDADTGQQVGSTGLGGPSDMGVSVVSRDGKVLYHAEAGLSGNLSVSRIDLNANSAGNIYGVLAGKWTSPTAIASLQDLATNGDGSRVYAAWGTDTFVRTFSYENSALVETAGLAPFPWPSNASGRNAGANIEVDPFGHVVTSVDPYLRIYLPNEQLVQDSQITSPSVIDFVSGMTGNLRITSDGLRILGNGRMFDFN
jgi:hypothetical protein